MKLGLNELEFLDFAKVLSDHLVDVYNKYYESEFFNGEGSSAKITCQNGDPKREHHIDKKIKTSILEFIDAHYDNQKHTFSILMEDYVGESNANATCSLIFDPCDGSKSADLNIGDPVFMVAFSPKAHDLKFSDLQSCFIRGFRSNDIYFVFQGKAFYIPRGRAYHIVDDQVIIENDYALDSLQASEKTQLKDCSIVIRDGYGMRPIVESKINHDVLNQAKHTFCYDISGIELSYVARNIINVLVEARKHTANNKTVGSDGFNLIPYPLIQATGAAVYDLAGKSLEQAVYDPYQVYDFICCSNESIMTAFCQDGIK